MFFLMIVRLVNFLCCLYLFPIFWLYTLCFTAYWLFWKVVQPTVYNDYSYKHLLAITISLSKKVLILRRFVSFWFCQENISDFFIFSLRKNKFTISNDNASFIGGMNWEWHLISRSAWKEANDQSKMNEVTCKLIFRNFQNVQNPKLLWQTILHDGPMEFSYQFTLSV